jgi:hypothetical protein
MIPGKVHERTAIMLSTLIITAAICGQQPAAKPAKPSALAPKAKAQAPVHAKPAPAEDTGGPIATNSLIAKRRAKKNAAYAARLRQEAAEARAQAKAMAEARKEFERQLPYLVQMRGQDLRRLSDAERNAMWNRYLNGGGAQGVIRGPQPQPPRIINDPSGIMGNNVINNP